MIKIKKHYIKALLTSFIIIAVIGSISLYDSEAFTKPFIDYSQAETLIPLDSMWEEKVSEMESAATEELTASTEIITAKTEIISANESTSTTETSTVDAITEITTCVTSLPKTTTINSAEISDLININTAGIEELKQLNGVGDVIAARIVEYAQTIGFKSIDEIKNVKGIGDKRYEKIKDIITV